jgi:hypothetical protein
LRRVLKTTAEEGRAMMEALNQLAGVLFLKADYAEAEVTVRRALDLNSQQAEQDDLKASRKPEYAGGDFAARGRISEADAAQRQALATFETAWERSSKYAHRSGEPGFSPGATRPLREAVAISRRVLAGREKLDGAQRPMPGDDPQQPGRI